MSAKTGLAKYMTLILLLILVKVKAKGKSVLLQTRGGGPRGFQ